MSGVYALMDTLLPFEWLHYTFMKNALIAIVLLTPLFGMLGTMAVDNKMAFFSDALGHSALTGIAIGVVLGWQSQMSAMLLFGLIWAVLITFVKHHSKMSADTIISVFSSTSIALGLVVLSRGGAFAKYSSVLVGDVLSVAQGDLLALLLALVGTIACWVFLFNPLLITSVNAPLAQSRGIRSRMTEYAFTMLVAVAVMVSIRWVGVMLINSLLILPAAALPQRCAQCGGVYAHERDHRALLRRDRAGAVVLPQHERGRGDCALLRGGVFCDAADAQKITLKTDISAHNACLRRAVML